MLYNQASFKLACLRSLELEFRVPLEVVIVDNASTDRTGLLGDVFKELFDLMINKNMPLGSVLVFVLLILPFSLTFTIPWGFLKALLLVLGRMSADNELVAIRTNGVSLLRVCAPVFLLAIWLSGLCLWINADVVPRAEEKMLSATWRQSIPGPAWSLEAP